jgi:hypothetical protein
MYSSICCNSLHQQVSNERNSIRLFHGIYYILLQLSAIGVKAINEVMK